MFTIRIVQKKIARINLRKFQLRSLVNNISSDFVVNSGQPDLQIPDVTLPEFLTGYQNKFENFVAIVSIRVLFIPKRFSV